MKHWFRALAIAIIAPLALAGCLFMPGKFDSTLTIHADRSFTFTYKGEVYAADTDKIGGSMLKASSPGDDKEAKPEGDEKAQADKPPSPEEIAKKDAEYRELAIQLAKEAGYRQVEYRGNGLFYVDYAISGVLSHGFVYPFNMDAEMLFPWVAIELRGKDTLRVKATGFAKADSSMTGGMGTPSESKAEGNFTLNTDAEIVSQNNEEGATTKGGMKTIVWKVTPRTDDAPMAVLKVKAN